MISTGLINIYHHTNPRYTLTQWLITSTNCINHLVPMKETKSKACIQERTYPSRTTPSALLTYKTLHEKEKEGWDYSLKAMKLIIDVLLPFIVPLFNTCFFVAYPIKFAMSILHSLPKKDNLKLMKTTELFKYSPS